MKLKYGPCAQNEDIGGTNRCWIDGEYIIKCGH